MNADICCLREGLIAELKTINDYRKLQMRCQDESVRRLFDSIIDEERVHVGEFQQAIWSLCEHNRKKEQEGHLEAQEIMSKTPLL